MMAAMSLQQNPCGWPGLVNPGFPPAASEATSPAEQPDVIQLFLQQAQQAQQAQQPKTMPTPQSQEMSPNPAAQADSEFAAVRLRGLPYDATEQDILAWFAKFDMVEQIADTAKAVRIFNKNNGKPMGLAVVMLNSKEDANVVVKTLGGQTMGSRYIEVFHHNEGEAGTDKAVIKGTTGGTSGTPQASKSAKASPEAPHPSPFDGASDTGGSGGSGGAGNPFPWPGQHAPTGFPGFPGIAPPFTPARAETDPNWEALFGFLKDPAPITMPLPMMQFDEASLAALGQSMPRMPAKDGESNLKMNSM